MRISKTIRSKTSRKGWLGQPRAGGALLISLMVVIVVASMGAVLIQSQLATGRTRGVQTDVRRAFYIAEAGLSEGLLAIAQGKSGSSGSADEPAGYASGVFWVEAESEGDLVTLRSTGLAGAGRRCLSITIRRVVNPIASLGFFSRGDLIVGSGSTIDGFDSRMGSFESQIDPALPGDTTGKDAQLNSNGDILIEAVGVDRDTPIKTFVYGDVSPGPEGGVLVDPGVSISGETAPRMQTATLPMIQVPSIVSQGSPALGRGLLIDGTDAGYDELNVPSGATLKIVGPSTVVVANLRVVSGGRLLFDTSAGPVTLHCLDNFVLEEGSSMEQSGTANEPVAIMISTNISHRAEALAVQQQLASLLAAEKVVDDVAALLADEGEVVAPAAPTYPRADLTQPAVVELGSSGTFRGILYAPLASLSIPSDLRVFGSVVATGLTLLEGARVSFDEALVANPIGASSLPRLISWRVVDLPDVPLVRSSIDPVLILRARGYTPPKATDIHKEESISIEYLDGRGAVNYYDGLYSDFNSARVVEVLGIDWYDSTVGEVPESPLPAPKETRQPDADQADENLMDTPLGPMTPEDLMAYYNSLSVADQIAFKARMLAGGYDWP